MAAGRNDIFRFGEFELNITRRLLLRGGEQVVLSAKAFDLLAELVANNGTVVSKDELLSRVWPDQIVEENNLTVQMSALRKQLGDGSGTQYIVTVPGRGYSFVARVETVEDADDIVIEQRTFERIVVEDNRSDVAQLTSASHRRWPLFALSALMLVLVGAGFYWWTGNRSDADTNVSSVAVLPFVYEGSGQDTDYLSEGIAESIISSLSTLPELSVRGRTSAFKYKNAVDVKKIGTELGVGALVSGRITENGDDVSLYAELTDTARDKVLWSQTYRGRRSELASLQSSLVLDVSSALRLKLSGAETARLKRNYPENSDAYRSYLKGRYFWNKRNIDGLKRSVDHYNEALKADPNFALAYVGLAESYVIFDVYSVSPARESMPLGRAAALKAIELDGTLAEAHNALAFYLACFEFKRDDAERKFRQAIELDPGNATAYHWLGVSVLGAQRRFDEALAALNKAEELDPLSPAIGMNIAATLADQGRYDEAEAKYRSVMSRNPEFGVGLVELSFISYKQRKYELAIEQVRESIRIDYDPLGKAYLGMYLAKSGKRDEAKKLLEELKRESKTAFVTNHAFALIHLGLGEKKTALDWLEKEIDERGYWTSRFAASTELEELRGEERFRNLLKRLNLPNS